MRDARSCERRVCGLLDFRGEPSGDSVAGTVVPRPSSEGIVQRMDAFAVGLAAASDDKSGAGTQDVRMGTKMVGDGHPALIVAELSANHNHDLDLALRTIDAVANSGADAVKLQTYTPDTITFRGDSEVFRVNTGSTWDGRSLHDLYSEAYTPWEWHERLFERAHENGLLCFSSPFDPSAVEFLENLNAPVYKVASFEITDIPLIRLMAQTGKPVIISTGVATAADITLAIEACRKVGNSQIVVLQCTSSYPANVSDANLRTMVDMRARFGVLVGLSDHTTDHVTAAAATALGACFIEKHVILDRGLGGTDSGFSLEPAELAEMVRLVRETESALGRVTYDLSPTAVTSRRFARSLFVVEDVLPGESVNLRNVRSIRPGDGLPPVDLPSIVGQTFAVAVTAGTPLAWAMLEDHETN